MLHLDSDLLRTFLAIADAGSVTAGAARIARSQSAASAQVAQLEAIVGRPLFHRHGRGITLTAAGEHLQPVARDITRTLDRTLDDLQGRAMTGHLRIGLTDDQMGATLSRIIASFAARFPDAELEVQAALGTGFDQALETGRLDLAVHEVATSGPGSEILRSDPLVWRAKAALADADPLPVALFDRACWWREAALTSLETAGRRHRVVFTSESAAGVRAAVAAGMAAGLLAGSETMDSVAPLAGLPSHPSHLVMRSGRGAKGPLLEAMMQAIRAALA